MLMTNKQMGFWIGCELVKTLESSDIEDQIPQAHPVFQKRVGLLLQPSASNNPKRLWQTVNKLLHVGVRAIFWRGGGSILPEKYGTASQNASPQIARISCTLL